MIDKDSKSYISIKEVRVTSLISYELCWNAEVIMCVEAEDVCGVLK